MYLSKNLQIYLKTTDTCNLNCAHCFTSGSEGKRVFFEPNTITHSVSRLVDQYNLESINIVLHGGEPMLAPLDDLKKIIKSLSQIPIQIQFGVQTNLVYPLSEEKLNFFNENFMPGMGTSWDYNIRFGSLNDTTEQRQRELWEKNVEKLVSFGHSLTLFVSLHKDLIEEVSPEFIINYAIKLGFKFIQFERITRDGNAKINTDIYISNQHPKWYAR